MKKLRLSEEHVHRGNLTLINYELPIAGDIEKQMLPADQRYPDILLEREAATVYAYVISLLENGEKIVPVSGYRTSVEQADIYSGSLSENGTKFTRKYVALPGHSEHQSGLAIDLGLEGDDIDFICPEFPYDGIAESFRRLAVNYGFIERYKEDKESITNIAHEPWHFRYVGYPHSVIMEHEGLCLEEYIKFVKGFEQGGRELKIEFDGKNFEIFFVPYNECGTTEVLLPENGLYNISGNNSDGFIVTVWDSAKV